MSDVLNSLGQIRTWYTVFEKDQVLTHDQLNGVSEYFDDQVRLSRVQLAGVGIVGGLRASFDPAAGTVRVTRGAGVTTDGDLLALPADVTYAFGRPYDASNPHYPPLFDAAGNTMTPAAELVATADVPQAVALAQLPLPGGGPWADMVAVLFAEAYVKDQGACSGTDCDNLGDRFTCTTKVLLVQSTKLGGLLAAAAATPAAAAAGLSPVVPARPTFPDPIKAVDALAAVYRQACDKTLAALTAELPKLYPLCGPFLGGTWPADLSGAWLARLGSVSASFPAGDARIQYYYDFLKDLADTYNRLRDALLDDDGWSGPNPAAFPKHLLLGRVVPIAADPDADRTPFYPSPAATGGSARTGHAASLARKLDNLIRAFVLPAGNLAVRVTPSRTEYESLEDRAIPFYYPYATARAGWSYRLHRRGMDDWAYGYGAAANGGKGGAAAPLDSPIGWADFFRIEGHVGMTLDAASAAIEDLVRKKNLPFTVRSVLVGPDRSKVVPRLPRRYTDLHRIHFMLRQDAAAQLDEVTQFSTALNEDVNNGVKAERTADSDPTSAAENDEATERVKAAAARHVSVIKNAGKAIESLRLPFDQFLADTTWRPAVEHTVQAAGEFKQVVGDVARNDFVTPFDTIIGSRQIQWVDWLRDLIGTKEAAADDRLLFAKFAEDHPSAEHAAGVPRGGTFVLLYDDKNIVVADVALDYAWPEEASDPADVPPPPAPVPVPRTPVVVGGVKIQSTFDKRVFGQVQDYVVKTVDPRIDFQKQYAGLLKDSVNLVAQSVGGVRQATTKPSIASSGITDDVLRKYIDVADVKRQQIEDLRTKAGVATDPVQQQELAALADETEQDLAKNIGDTATYLAATRADTTVVGSDADLALRAMSDNATKLTSETAKTDVATRLQTAQGKTTIPGLKQSIGRVFVRP